MVYIFKKYKLPGSFIYFNKNKGAIEQTAIKQVIYANPATVVFWEDGTKTTSKCYKNDSYNPETGLAMCILKKLYGPAEVKKVVDAWIPKTSFEQGKPVCQTLADVRKISNK